MILPYNEHTPSIPEDALVAPDATVIGWLEMAPRSSIWFGAVVRADNDRVVLGEGSNIQDHCVVHVDDGVPCLIGRDCVIGHRAVLHGCTLGDRVLIGIGAIVLNHAHIPDDVVVAAGALVPERARLESGKLYMGVPAKPVRDLRPDELERVRYGAQHYAEKIPVYQNLFAGL